MKFVKQIHVILNSFFTRGGVVVVVFDVVVVVAATSHFARRYHFYLPLITSFQTKNTNNKKND